MDEGGLSQQCEWPPLPQPLFSEISLMSRMSHDDIDVRRMVVMFGLRLATMTKTLTGTFTMTNKLPPAITLDPGGATPRKVLMPSETDAENIGLTFYIRNGADAAEDLQIRDSGDTTTLGTISQSEAAIITLMPAIAGAATYSWVVGVDTTT